VAITVKVDVTDWNNAMRRLARDAPRAASRALNRTAQNVQTVAVRLMAQDVGLQNNAVRPSVKIDRATPARPAAAVRTTGKRIPLIAFNASGPEPSRGRGRVTYRIGRGGRHSVPGSFIATMPSGHRGVFKRRTTRRLPISELFGPSLPRVMLQPPTLKAMNARAHEQLPVNFKRELDFTLRDVNQPTRRLTGG
jgi:Prophage minor tail protein Z (GPZ)